MLLGKTPTFTLAFMAVIIASGASAATRIAPVTGTNPAWINASDSAPRLYLRPVHTEAFAACEWVRVRAATGARWRALCS